MLLCQLVFQPVIRVIQFVVATIQYILITICRLIEELVSVVTQVLEYVCNTVVRTVCSAVCSVICGICDFFCGIFGCDCGCRNVCNSVCSTVTDFVCGWTYVLRNVLEYVTRLVCDYILKAIIVFLNVILTIVTMVLTWVCSLIDWVIRWFLCWTYLAEIFNSTKPRRFKVAPKIVPNSEGHSDWFIYVNNPNGVGQIDQNLKGYILSDRGRPLTPVVDLGSGTVAYVEVVTREDVITGELRRRGRELVPGRPFLYYPGKVMEIGSHLFGDVFAGDPADDGRGTQHEKNLFTYSTGVQSLLAARGTLTRNNYNLWADKYTNPSSGDYFGDRSLPDVGIRVDTDATCSRPTNTFLHLVSDISFTRGDTSIAEEMTCGSGQTLSLDETNFLMQNKHPDGCAVTTYFVSRYEANHESVGCNDLLGYTIITSTDFADDKVLEYTGDANEMMARVVDNVSGRNPKIVRVAETYLHECAHQSGLLHDEDTPDCADTTTLDIAMLMDPGASMRRALTRWQWCMMRGTCYCTRQPLTPFVQTPELTDSRSASPDEESSQEEKQP